MIDIVHIQLEFFFPRNRISAIDLRPASYREGFPNVVLQAAAMEVPCIVSNINGCNEIIQEGVNGALVPPKQVQPLIEKMILFFEQQTTLHTFTRQARLEVETHFERKQFWDYLLNEYKDQEQYVSSH